MSFPALLYDNRFDDATPTATSEATGFEVTNIVDLKPYTQWKGTGSGILYVKVNLSSAATADTLAIIGHDLNTQGATISVEYSNDDFAADINEALAPFAPTDDKLIWKEFTSRSDVDWRLKIAAGYTSPPSIGVLMIGARTQFPQRVTNRNFDPTGQRVISTTQRSQTGNLLGSAIRYRQLEILPSWDILLASFVDGALKTFLDNHGFLLKPFFFAWDASEEPTEIFFVSLSDNFSKRFPFNGTYKNISLSMRGIIEQ